MVEPIAPSECKENTNDSKLAAEFEEFFLQINEALKNGQRFFQTPTPAVSLEYGPLIDQSRIDVTKQSYSSLWIIVPDSVPGKLSCPGDDYSVNGLRFIPRTQ